MDNHNEQLNMSNVKSKFIRIITFKDEGGLADTTGTVENEWLMDAVAVSVVVENGFHDWPWYDPPCFVHHFSI